MTPIQLFAFVILPAIVGIGGLSYALIYRWYLDREAKRLGK